MKLSALIERLNLEVINHDPDNDVELSKVFCCDLLSIAMSKAPAQSVWITVMGNVNAIAVAVLTDIACIILAENAPLDNVSFEKAKSQGVTVLKTDLPIFDIGLTVESLLHHE